LRQTFSILLLLVPILAALAGAVLLWLGLRGSKIDNHPICRKCGFDLFGLDMAVKCPECGADLEARDAIRLGHRERRAVPLTAGLVLLTSAMAVLLAIGLSVARGVDLNGYKPVWLLVREGDAVALAQLNARFTSGRLSDDQIHTVVEHALVAQANVTRPWQPMWGNLLFAARRAGKVTDGQLKRYAEQATQLRWEARPLVRRGDPIPVRARLEPARVGNTDQLSVGVDLVDVELDGRPLRRAPVGPSRHTSLHPGADGSVFEDAFVAEPAVLEALADGQHPFRARARVFVIDSARGRGRSLTLLADRSDLFEANVRLAPADKPSAEAVVDPNLRERLHSSLAYRGMGSGGRDQRAIQVEANGFIAMAVAVTDAPVGIASDVLLRDENGAEHRMGSVDFAAGKRDSRVFFWLAKDFDADRVAVVFRPSLERAVATTYLTRFWGEEVVFRNVPVIWSPAAQRPLPKGVAAPATTRSSP
jgi:hypothetical protein